MFSLETFQNQVSAVMDALVESAVAELSRLLDERSGNVMAAEQRCAAAPGETAVKSEELVSDGANKDMTASHAHTSCKTTLPMSPSFVVSVVTAAQALTSELASTVTSHRPQALN